MFPKFNRVLMNEAGEGGEGGGATPRTYTQEEFDAAVAGLKSNNEKLLTEKKEARAKN